MTPNGNFGLDLEQRVTPSMARFEAIAKIIDQSLRVALPGIVQTFTPGPPAMVSVIIATNELATQNTAGASSINPDTQALQLPLLKNVPVYIPSAGGYSLTFPIQPGDECLVVFCDTPTDVWLQNGGVNNNPISQRRHDLSDGVAILGLRSKPRAITGYSTSSAQLRNDAATVIIDLADDQITITAPTVTVNAETVNIAASDKVNITGDTQVLIGNASMVRDFLSHTHSGGGLLPSTGAVL